MGRILTEKPLRAVFLVFLRVLTAGTSRKGKKAANCYKRASLH